MHLPICFDQEGQQAESNPCFAEGGKDLPTSTTSESLLGNAGTVEPTSGPVFVRPFQTSDKEAFRTLNEAWISRYFVIEPEDTELLSDPEGKILASGGYVFVAIVRQDGEEEIIGCFALLPLPANTLRLARMTVREDHRGKGVGRKLLHHAIITARALHAQRLVLETSHKLESAVHLYQSEGFCFALLDPTGPRPLARADLYMELVLPDG